MDITTYNEIQRGIKFIKGIMDNISHKCENAGTIEASNRLWNEALDKAKTKFYKTLNTVHSDEVMNHINKYYKI